MSWLRIVGLCVSMAIGYGVLHDLVTAQVCVEYFSIGHEDLFGSEHPVVLAVGWGVVATWYIGAALAIPLICAARLGTAPPRGARELVRPLLILLGAMASCALLAGVIGWWAARSFALTVPGMLGDLVPRAQHAHFIAVWCAHAASYLSAVIGGLVVLPLVVWQQRQAA